MRGSIVVLSTALTLGVASLARAQGTPPVDPGSQKCVLKQGGNPSATGTANRADPTTRGNKNCVPVVLGHASISGTVFFDLNENGLFDDDEVGLAGWQVQLTAPNGSQQAILTDGDGNYSFAGLSAGTYTVCLLPPMGWTQISPTAGPACPTSIGYTIMAPAQVADSFFPGTNFGWVSN